MIIWKGVPLAYSLARNPLQHSFDPDDYLARSVYLLVVDADVASYSLPD